MSNSSRKSSSQHSRSSAHGPFKSPDLSYPEPTPDTGSGEFPDPFQPSSYTSSSTQQYQSQDFAAFGQDSSFLHPTYPPRNPSPQSARSKVETSRDSHFAAQSDLLFSGQDDTAGSMMSHRDMGYGYMPSPIPSYSHGQSYGSTLAPMPGYFPDAARNISGSSGPHYLPELGFRMASSGERDQIQRRRRRNSTERRHQAKLLSRKTRLPSITGIGLEENQVSSSPVDLFATAPSIQQQTYVPDSINRSYSRPSMSPMRDDFRQSGHHGYDLSQQSSQTSYQPQQPYQSQPPYQPAYTMTSMNPSTLAPPILPASNASYPAGRSSPLLQTPLPPASVSISPQREPVVVDRPQRDKPQCWDHGCNGREFSTFSNLLRHQREKSGSAAKAYCPRCGAEFTRTTARNGHMEHGKCKSRRPSAADTTGSNHSSSSLTR